MLIILEFWTWNLAKVADRCRPSSLVHIDRNAFYLKYFLLIQQKNVMSGQEVTEIDQKLPSAKDLPTA